ncbi:2-hydroxyacyl-CoA dehydratase subunit D [Clostridium aminobutyricum]|uniref:2-hydroxyacyl-CoA dehydratase n=1 Tax=Clostridium aminobutyricum TaxID=33953 RepID=A0A939D9Y3_CLOAM|nr:2-hydroxyacyl-CoA dehydratase family protein [Clostridium aminobutyricum]MBN7774109.1 2-hydroxyacyl-CoA dehydratase [Clostridium aminobutyricum]
MNQQEVLINQFIEDARNPKKAVEKALSVTGKKAFGCFPIYTPEEIIYAANLLPVGMWGGQTQMSKVDSYIQSFCCSIMRANVEQGMNGVYDFLEGIIIPTFCDTMKAVLANWPVAVPTVKAIPFVYPQNRTSESSAQFLISQYRRFQSDLEELIGTKISEEALEKSFVIYEEYRATMRDFVELVNDYPKTLNPTVRHLIIKSSYFNDKADYTTRLQELMNEIKKTPKEEVHGPKVVLTGLMTEPEQLLDLFTENGYTIAADDLAHESRQYRVPARADGTAIEKMAYRVMDLKGCTFFYEENKTRGTMLKNLVEKHHADAVVVCLFKFCDPEEFDYPVYKKELDDSNIKMLYLEVDQQMDSVEQLRTRIQSFAEILL